MAESEQHQWRGQEFYESGKFEEAVTEWHLASVLAPDDANNYLWIGFCLRVRADRTRDQMGWKAARAALQKAIEIDPVSSYAHHALGGMHWRLKRKQEAVSEFRTAVSLNPNNIEAQMALGVSQVRTEDFRGSIQTIRTINGLPNGKELRQYLADPDRSRERCQFLLSIGAGLAVILAGVWIWRRK